MYFYPEQKSLATDCSGFKIILMENLIFSYTAEKVLELTQCPTSSERSKISKFSPNNAIAPCIGCGGIKINLVKMPDYSTHWAAGGVRSLDTWGLGTKPAKKKQQRRQVTLITAEL